MTRGTGDLRALWRTPGFGKLLGVRVVSLGADGLFQTSLASSIFFSPERAATAGQAAAGFAVLLLPYSVVGPFTGPLLDHWRRTRVLALGNLLRAAVVLVAAVSLLTTGPIGPMFLLTALTAVSIGRLHSAASLAALPHVVAGDRLVLANSVWTVCGLIGGAAGTGLGLGIRHLGDASDWTAAVSALIAGGSTRHPPRWPRPSPPRRSARNPRCAPRHGLWHAPYVISSTAPGT
ncbi:MAG: MFS transporter [Actinophytocola sp.]|uniref:MFS transporter n=1 Tax=Actinophytocola sp. TaxID=1872138 RepID=UPI0013232852|nr:MFS transporter [Actinophytocola sp.]MPZ83204.1 MFS transporter [Actinophytocola sp.]